MQATEEAVRIKVAGNINCARVPKVRAACRFALSITNLRTGIEAGSGIGRGGNIGRRSDLALRQISRSGNASRRNERRGCEKKLFHISPDAPK
jgi:hypothetical protein